ncbi:hypothetical protein CGRA01v4_07446 [Colletotrichum graminicola]|uniref:Uncharacterized protein n=1 Tax=Colletotrichum graminicola (strain M1.001 / M2 / FGSC 10212) TaxID=645133 RepID=E3Q8I2_COLGM|nr:uncharacterized protein GLRG_02365 [Colletotrichum graminicola M1.001]EFQ27194.1 hypothetical protein GLRG_02365 [Colletotrichum graminicola M1.001]WDK16165.1 hypothetical protein CGRA01v4_07446 [Colletotrichum graminicola]
MSDVYRKTGRGGSGNFYSKKDVENVQKANSEDLEAQKTTNATAAAAATGPRSPTAGGYARVGRGGAGNFHDPSSLPDAKQQEEAADKTRAAVSASLSRSARGASGRGGAGNYGDSSVPGGGGGETAEDEAERKQALERKIIEDVEAGLPMPPRAYQHATKKDEESA